MFRLSKRSLNNLEGVDPDLVGIVKLAITRTEVDFGVIEGLRTRERQAELVRAGASKTMNSKHLTGRAVDLLAYINGRGSWELPLYFEIAEAMRSAARDLEVGIRWGGSWVLNDIRSWDMSMEEANALYVEQRLGAGKRIFIDGPHFELSQ